MNKPMASNISTSLIISTYNRSDALELCVKKRATINLSFLMKLSLPMMVLKKIQES